MDSPHAAGSAWLIVTLEYRYKDAEWRLQVYEIHKARQLPVVSEPEVGFDAGECHLLEIMRATIVPAGIVFL